MYQDMPAGLDPEIFHPQIYSSVVARFSCLSGMNAIVARTRTLLEDHFHPFEPTLIHRHFSAGDLASKITEIQRIYGRSDEILDLWRLLFLEVGFNPEHIAHDRIILRFLPPLHATTGQKWHRSTAPVRFHRDTWGTNLYAQVNWWAPIYSLEAGRTLRLYPQLWNRRLANNSGQFDIRESMTRIRQTPESIGPEDLIPTASEPIEESDSVAVLLDPGEIIAFSAQHAHGAVPNRTGVTRISVETRTLSIADFRAGRGAPNIDGMAPLMMPGLFSRLSDGSPLPLLTGGSRYESYGAVPR